MKSLIVALSLVVSALSFAAEVKIYEAPAWSSDKLESASFKMNEKLGRVWVELTIADRFDVEDMGDTEWVKVPGLSFDPALNAAVLDIEGQLVECAVVRQRGILVFRHNYLKNTNCSFKSKMVTKLVDDGFEIHKRRYIQVFIVTKE